MEDYVDLGALAAGGEELVGPIESADFTPGPGVTPVGDYISHTRKITGKQKEDGNITFTVELTGGVQNPETGKVFNARFPLKTWISTKPYAREGVKGTTSGVADYLRACGMSAKSITSKQELVEALQSTENIPVMVFVGRTDRSEKLGDGTYSEPLNLKLKDFLLPDGTYADSIERDGQVIRAKEKVGGFRKI